MAEVYLDYNATAPLDLRVADVMFPLMTDMVGNASSSHRFGRRQFAVVDKAREQVAALVGCQASSVVFTSGATEANNLALCGLAMGYAHLSRHSPVASQKVQPGAHRTTQPVAPQTNCKSSRRRVIISSVEHASVARAAKWLSRHGFVEVDVLGVTPGGFVDIDLLDRLLSDDVLLVSVMAANSETGIINDVGAVAERAKAVGAIVHCDATQSVGRVPFSIDSTGVDMVSLSSHKICGPSGVGALVVNRSSRKQMEAIMHGGGQEHGLRAGSLNVPGIAGFGAAAHIAMDERETEAARVHVLRDDLVEGLFQGLTGVHQNGDTTRRLPNTANIRFEGAYADAMLVNMDPVAVSTGSACNSAAVAPSEVLTSMGMSHEAAFESVRFSLGRFTTAADVTAAVAKTVSAVRAVRHVRAF